MRAIRLDDLSADQLRELDVLYHTTHDVRVRTRALMILLAAEQRLVAFEIAAIVRESAETVRRWFRRYQAEGVNGLADAPRPGKPAKVTAEYRERLLELVRRRPRALDLPFSTWTAARLADHLAEAGVAGLYTDDPGMLADIWRRPRRRHRLDQVTAGHAKP